MSAPIRLVVIGAGGRMGRSLLNLLPEFPALVLGAAVVAPGSKDLGQPGHGAVPMTADLPAALSTAGLAIDFSSAPAAAGNLQACVAAGVPLLLGTTGLAEDLQPRFELAAARIPLLVAANTSLAVNLLLELARRTAQVLPESFLIDIFEAHHKDKLDAPSGTALALGAAVEAGRGRACHVGYTVARGGDQVGEHRVHFNGAGERLTLSHVAADRAVFARGALAAGAWLAGQPPGRYRMQDLLGEK